jgi:hypothetical protein
MLNLMRVRLGGWEGIARHGLTDDQLEQSNERRPNPRESYRAKSTTWRCVSFAIDYAKHVPSPAKRSQDWALRPRKGMRATGNP